MASCATLQSQVPSLLQIHGPAHVSSASPGTARRVTGDLVCSTLCHMVAILLSSFSDCNSSMKNQFHQTDARFWQCPRKVLTKLHWILEDSNSQLTSETCAKPNSFLRKCFAPAESLQVGSHAKCVPVTQESAGSALEFLYTFIFSIAQSRTRSATENTGFSNLVFSSQEERRKMWSLIWFTLEDLQSLFPKLTAYKISTPEHKRSSKWACAQMPNANNKPKIKCPDFHVMNYLWLLLLPLSHGLTSRVTPPVFVCCLICLAIKRKKAFTNN